MKSCGVNVFLLVFICSSLGRKTCAALINIDTTPDKEFIEELSLISEFSLVFLSDTRSHRRACGFDSSLLTIKEVALEGEIVCV